MSRGNRLLGKFHLTGLAPAPRGREIEVTFDVNADGILSVSAKDTAFGANNELTVVSETGRLS